MQKLRLVEEGKVLTHLIHVERRAVYFEQRTNVIQIAGSRGIVHEALQFEANEQGQAKNY